MNVHIINDELLEYFNDEYTMELKKVGKLQEELIQCKGDMERIKRKAEQYRLQQKNRTHRAFSPLPYEEEFEEIPYETQLETLQIKFNEIKNQLIESNKKVDFFKDKKAKVKEWSKKTLELEQVSQKFLNIDKMILLTEQEKQIKEITGDIKNSISKDIKNIESKIILANKLLELDTKRSSIELLYGTKIVNRLHEKINLIEADGNPLFHEETNLYSVLLKLRSYMITIMRNVDFSWNLKDSFIKSSEIINITIYRSLKYMIEYFVYEKYAEIIALTLEVTSSLIGININISNYDEFQNVEDKYTVYNHPSVEVFKSKVLVILEGTFSIIKKDKAIEVNITIPNKLK